MRTVVIIQDQMRTVNGLLKRYLPKRKNIDKLTQEELNDIVHELNNRPKKRD